MEDAGAIIRDGHFVYRSGLHGSTYVNKDAIYPHTVLISRFCAAIAAEFMDDEVEVVIAPAIGGVVLTQWTAYHLSAFMGREVLAVYVEKNEHDDFIFTRGYDDLAAGKHALIVEDILTTGGSVKKVIGLARGIGVEIIGLGAICNRGGVTVDDVGGVPRLFALSNLKFETWEPGKCPWCIKGIPINRNVGKGRKFLAEKMTLNAP